VFDSNDADTDALVTRHLRFGWWAILVFLILGISLEAMHAFRVGWYLNVSNEGRRLLLTLAHAHGVLLGVLQLCFAATLNLRPLHSPRLARGASAGLRSANVLLPGGFLLGGLVTYGSEPGFGILLVPVGGALLLASVLAIAVGLRR
jgi:hypothetical protein